MIETQIPSNTEVDLYRNVLVEIKEKMARVEYLMEKFEDTRNDDSLLCLLYWKLVEGAENLDDILWLTKPEVIRRSRQKIQEKGILLPTDDDVYKRRRFNERIVRQGIQQLN